MLRVSTVASSPHNQSAFTTYSHQLPIMASISRINSTNTGGFDQITAVSQEMINDQLKTTMNSIPELKSFEPEDAIWGKFSTVFKNAMLDPCHCKIPASGNNFSSVLFYVCACGSVKVALDNALNNHAQYRSISSPVNGLSRTAPTRKMSRPRPTILRVGFSAVW